MSGHLSEHEARRVFVAANLRAIGRMLDRIDQLALLPEDETGEALQALVNVEHVFRILVGEEKL